MKIVREEIFGPVGVIIKFKDESEVLEMANDTTYGLSACIYTKDVTRATKMANALQAGSVYVRALPPSTIVPPAEYMLPRSTAHPHQTGVYRSEDSSSPALARIWERRLWKGKLRSSSGTSIAHTYHHDRYTNVKAVHVNIGQKL